MGVVVDPIQSVKGKVVIDCFSRWVLTEWVAVDATADRLYPWFP